MIYVQQERFCLVCTDVRRIEGVGKFQEKRFPSHEIAHNLQLENPTIKQISHPFPYQLKFFTYRRRKEGA